MKLFFFLSISPLVLLNCSAGESVPASGEQDSANTATETNPRTLDAPYSYFTLVDAEAILGEPAELTESVPSGKKASTRYQCTYTALDSASGRKGILYFMYEEYADSEAAHTVYDGIFVSNQPNGAYARHDLGDEGYFHTDNENFYFIMARKGTKMIRIKVNKITPFTSLDELNRISVEIMNVF